MYNFIKAIFKQTTILNREKYKEIEHLLDDDTKYFLFEFGLPEPKYLVFEFIDSDFYNTEHNILCIGHNGGKFGVGSYIGIDLNTNEIIMFYNFGESLKCVLGPSLKHFILIMFEFEMFSKMFGETSRKEYFGKIDGHKSRRSYIEYLNFRLLQIDRDFFQMYNELYLTDKNYYWGSILEEMENGIIGPL
jgi:hypothetical protein